MRAIRVLGLIALSSVIIGCAEEQAFESKGTITELDGQVTVLSEEEAEEVCSTQFCEPNYVYYASFGSNRPSPPPPQPAPPPPPPPAPTPPPSPPPVNPGNENLTYAQTIMNVPSAWNFSEGAREIVVAVVDSGVEVDHRDLAANIWRNEVEANGQRGVDDDGNGYVDDVYGYDFANNRPNGIDDNRHGTHVAGTIAAVRNRIGVIGMAPQVRIMPVKFLDARGSGTTDAAIRAINYAIDNGAHVISNSWGGGGRSQLLDDAIQRAVNRGIFVVAAAGNESKNNDSRPSYPANYANVISVASTDQSDRLSSFSNFGSNTVEIAAPGSNILSTVLNDGWAQLSGTSMATPQVSGALALALSINRSLTRTEALDMMCDSARKIHLNATVCGRMDVGAFIQAVDRF